MAREVGIDNDIDINSYDWMVFPNAEAKNDAGNGKAMQSPQRSLSEAQGLLERNRMLLQEIGRNHEAREAGCLNRNTTLIFELHNNMVRVCNLYSDLSSSLSRSIAKGSPAAVDSTNVGYKETAASPIEETN